MINLSERGHGVWMCVENCSPMRSRFPHFIIKKYLSRQGFNVRTGQILLDRPQTHFMSISSDPSHLKPNPVNPVSKVSKGKPESDQVQPCSNVTSCMKSSTNTQAHSECCKTPCVASAPHSQKSNNQSSNRIRKCGVTGCKKREKASKVNGKLSLCTKCDQYFCLVRSSWTKHHQERNN